MGVRGGVREREKTLGTRVEGEKGEDGSGTDLILMRQYSLGVRVEDGVVRDELLLPVER